MCVGHTFCRPAEGETNSSFYRNLNAVAQDHIAQDMRSIRQMYDGLRRLAVLLSKFMPWSAHLAMLEEYSVATENSPHVRTFLDWIAVAQLTKGPLIPRLTRNGKSLHVAHRKGHLRSGRENNNAEVYYTADGKLVHMSTSMLSNELSEMFKEGGYDTSKTHMLRKASIMWMARGGLSAAQIKAFSRHSDKSSSFYRYIQEGILESEMNTLDGGIDVIFSIWTPKPAAVANVMERQSN